MLNLTTAGAGNTLDSMFNVSVPTPLDVAYTSVETLCAVVSVAGNSAVIYAFVRCRCLRTVTNYYVISLAVADLLVGLVGIPSALATSVGLPGNFRLCILMNSVLLLLCTGSILSLVAVTVDRFWAIVYPFNYSRDMTHRRAVWVIGACWLTAAFIGLLPSMGWNRGEPPRPRCFFMEVIDFRYLVFIYFLTIIAPTVFMAVVYGVIYRVVRHHIHQLSLHTPSHQLSAVKPSTSPLKQTAETKAAKSIALIVLLFVVSWLPLYTINTVIFFCSDCTVPSRLIEAAIVLSHFNSAFNPALYAWGMRDFREAFVAMVRSSPLWRRSPDTGGRRDRRETTTDHGFSSRLTVDRVTSQTVIVGAEYIKSSKTTLSNSIIQTDNGTNTNRTLLQGNHSNNSSSY